MTQRAVRAQRLLALFALGCLAFSYPLLSLFATDGMVFGIPVLVAYLFGGWMLFMLLMAAIVERGP